MKPGFRQFSKKSTYSFNMFMRVAAVILITLTIASYFIFISYISDETSPLAMQEISTEVGQIKTLRLYDQTEIKLNSVSSLQIPQNLEGDSIEVFLVGEAYFDVARINEREFIVHAGDVSVRVLGTGFNVKAWPEEESIEVTVNNGEVSVKSIEGNDKVILTGGEKSFIARGESPSSPIQFTSDNEFAWINGMLIFNQTPMNNVIRSLERKYRVEFQVDNDSILTIPLTGEFKDESMIEILDMIAFSVGVNYKQENSVIKLYRPEVDERL